MNGLLVILSGPSGVGKDTLIDAWQTANPRVNQIVTYTTRTPREGETDGVDYHFVGEDEFRAMARSGDFLEWKEVHGAHYGSPRREAEESVARGEIAVLKIDVQGAMDVLAMRPDALSVFILPPSMEELERRIRTRAQDDEAAIARRLRNAEDEIAQSDKYAFRVVNDDVDRAVRELEALVR